MLCCMPHADSGLSRKLTSRWPRLAAGPAVLGHVKLGAHVTARLRDNPARSGRS